MILLQLLLGLIVEAEQLAPQSACLGARPP
jgi:hypothetical protein